MIRALPRAWDLLNLYVVASTWLVKGMIKKKQPTYCLLKHLSYQVSSTVNNFPLHLTSITVLFYKTQIWAKYSTGLGYNELLHSPLNQAVWYLCNIHAAAHVRGWLFTWSESLALVLTLTICFQWLCCTVVPLSDLWKLVGEELNLKHDLKWTSHKIFDTGVMWNANQSWSFVHWSLE